MSNSHLRTGILLLVLFCSITTAYSQDKSVKVSAMDGIVVAGYVDDGAFVNFSGPNISYKSGSSRLVIGMIPSLRIKEDKSTATKNSIVVPALGVGLAYVYKRVVFQVPLYYNAKNSTSDGKWVIGGGLGWKFQR